MAKNFIESNDALMRINDEDEFEIRLFSDDCIMCKKMSKEEMKKYYRLIKRFIEEES